MPKKKNHGVAVGRGIDVRSLFQGQGLDAKIVEKAVSEALSGRLKAEFDARETARQQFSEPMRRYISPLLELISHDQNSAKALRDMRKLLSDRAKRKLPRPRPVKEKERIWLGSFGATWGPPYDYAGTWHAVSGNPGGDDETADKSSGDMGIFICSGATSTSISANVILGIYFYPFDQNTATLRFWANPGYTYLWSGFATFAECHYDVWIGTATLIFDRSGSYQDLVVNQQINLCSESTSLGGGATEGANSGFVLSPAPFEVDNDHQYLLCVWAAADISASGWGTLSGSGALASINLSVPGISWEIG
ncbi:hypothetical protein FAZ95_37080 [Trinickia violacea]|uniref:Uncharacterized protein n=1 Tax=Trinickia violacea TaxID=2571746 RepID=A0A4P8J675_9BURK|nr:hypothetical protein [Trinickia violacea]QCP54509.1 hypothetical protein FAZ95_37080 [Trinickia violacea]